MQDSLDDDSSTLNGALEQPDNDSSREDFRAGDVVKEDAVQVDSEDFDAFPQAYNGRKRDQVDRKRILMSSVADKLPDREGKFPFPPEAPAQNPGSRRPTSVYPREKFGTPYNERYVTAL